MNTLSNTKLTSLYQHTQTVLRIFFGLPATVLSFLFLGKILLSSQSTLSSLFSHVNVLLLTVGVIFLLFYFFLRALVFEQLLLRKSQKIPSVDNFFLFSFAELKRYIPGNIFSFAARISSYSSYSVTAKTTSQLLFFEALILIFSSILLSIPSLLYLNNQLQSTYLLLSSFSSPLRISIFSGILLVASITLLTVGFYTLRKHITLKHIFSYTDVFALALLQWFFFGIGSYCVASSIAYLEPYRFFEISSIFVLGWLLGYISFITPMGLGVREAVIAAGLTSFTPLFLASAISLFVRITLIVCELLFLLLSFFMYKLSNRTIFQKIVDKKHIMIVFIAILAYILYFSYVTIEKHNNFYTGRFDLGNMDQTVWNSLHGRIFTLTNPDNTNIISRLGIHADFILVLLSPFYLLWQDPRMLLIIQTVGLATGALCVYMLAQYVLAKKMTTQAAKNISVMLSISYLLNPLVARQNLYDFHAVTLATTFLLASFYFLVRFLDEKASKASGILNFLKSNQFFFLLFLILATLTKENIYLISSLIGFYLIVRGKRIFGTALSCFSIIAFYLLVAKFIPQAAGAKAHFAVSYFTDFGDSPLSIVKTLLFNPLKLFSSLLTQQNFDYIHVLTLSTGYFSFLSPLFLIFSFPDLIINLLSSNLNLKSINFQYTAPIIPFLYVSSIYGIATLSSKRFKNLRISPKIIFYYLLIITIYSAWKHGPLPGAAHPSIEMMREKLPERQSIFQFISKIPPQFSVAATNNIGAHLSHREKIYTIPNGIGQADIVMFLLNDVFAQPSLEEQIKKANAMKNDKNYTVVYEEGPFIAFERRTLELAHKISIRKPEIYPYSLEILKKRSYQKGTIVFEKILKKQKEFTLYRASYLSDGLVEYALVAIPAQITANSSQAIFLAHDLRNQRTFKTDVTNRDFIEHFAKKGFIIIRPDYRGYGDSEHDQNSAERFTYPVDCLNLIASLTSLPLKVSTLHFFAEGIGSEITLKTLEVMAEKKDLQKLIGETFLYNPVADPIVWYTHYSEQITDQTPAHIQKLHSEIGTPNDNPSVWQTLSPLNYLKNVRTHITIIQDIQNEMSISEAHRLHSILSFYGVPTRLIVSEKHYPVAGTSEEVIHTMENDLLQSE